MVDQRALRQRRLENEYKELTSLNGDVLRIEPLGSAPYEKYRITFNVRTIISPAPAYRDKTVCILTISAGYPDVVPKMAVDDSSMPAPWHPNWYQGGTWCFGYWAKEESLANYIYRCAKTIQFSPELTDARIDAAANKDAVPFWNANKDNRRVIPTDQKKIPTVDSQPPTISILPKTKPRISFKTN